MTNTTNTIKGFFVNTYHSDGSVHSSTYFRTEDRANARAERMRKVYSKSHPNRMIKVEKHRVK